MLNKEAAWGGVWVKGSTFRILGLLPGSGTTPEQMLRCSVTQFPPLPGEILSLPFPMLWKTTKICSWRHHHPLIPHPTNVLCGTESSSPRQSIGFVGNLCHKKPQLRGLQVSWTAANENSRTLWMQLGARDGNAGLATHKGELTLHDLFWRTVLPQILAKKSNKI